MTSERDEPGYSFGHSKAAAARLQIVDQVFSEPTRALLGIVAQPIGLAVDLGCGPGYSTRLVAEVVRPARLVGLDISEAFLDHARGLGLHAAWQRHDVTAVPFPTGLADLLHARFVLSHILDPEGVLVSWLEQLNRGGHLLVQEDEQILTDHPVLAAYEDMARGLVAHRGGDLWAGARLAEVDPANCEVVINRVYAHQVAVPLAARMYSMNFKVWRHDPFISRGPLTSTLDGLAADLDWLASSDEPGQVTFEIRQLGYRRG